MLKTTERQVYIWWLAAVILTGTLSFASMFWPRDACSEGWACDGNPCSLMMPCVYPCGCAIRQGETFGTCHS